MNPEELKVFLESLKNTDIEELCFEAGEQKVFIKKGEVAHIPEPKEKPKAGQAAAAEVNTLAPFKSPMVGTFYHSESADHPPFVIEGNHVVPGQKIGFIETMKIIKDVTSNMKGKIAKISVKNGQSVEYGQELFLIDTAADEEEKE
jgi:biotin carboxyl carrier protein